MYVANFKRDNVLLLNQRNQLTMGQLVWNGFLGHTRGPAINGRSRSEGATAVDVDGNGAMDLFLVNEAGPNQLFIQRSGLDLFVEQKSGLISGRANSYGVVAVDVNGDQWAVSYWIFDIRRICRAYA